MRTEKRLTYRASSPKHEIRFKRGLSSNLGQSHSPLDGFAYGEQEHRTLACGVRRKEFRHVVIKKSQPRGAKTLSIGGKI